MSTASEPNKPMVPTATHGLDEDSMTSWRRHIGQSLGAERWTTSDEQLAAGGEGGNEERRGGLAVEVFDSSWRTFAVRAAVLGGVVFGAVRLAGAREGVPSGPARTSVTVAGTLTGVTEPAMARFRFYDAPTGGNLLCESSQPINGGAFSVEIPLEGARTTGSRCLTMFDGANVFVEVVINDTLVGGRSAINPVPYAHFASVAGQYGTPDCPAGYERVTDTFFTADKRLCVRRRADRTAYDEVVRVGTGPSAFWIDRYEASVWENADGSGAGYPPFPSTFSQNGQWTRPAFSLSRANVQPSTGLTWFQANAACRASGKRLMDADEWLAAAMNTPDPRDPADGSSGECRTSGTTARLTGRGTLCVSFWGAQDMIGNVAEFTREWYASSGIATSVVDADGGVTAISDSTRRHAVLRGVRVNPYTILNDVYGNDRVINVSSVAINLVDDEMGTPTVAVRGGGRLESGAGVYSLELSSGPAYQGSMGFRCVIPR